MDWINNIDWVDVAEKALALYGIAQVIVRATPTKKDDKIVSKVGKILNFIFSATKTKK